MRLPLPEINLIPMKIAAITGGKNEPSRRFRIHALKPDLEACGIQLDELCPRISKYPPKRKILRPLWFISALAERSTYTWRARGFDAVILQREMISTIPTIERLIPGPKVLDVDDAIYMHRGGVASRNCAHVCELIVCGNDWLADHFSKWHNNIEIIPTGVDVTQLMPLPIGKVGNPVVGWIGTSGNLRFLEPFAKSIASALSRVDGAVLHIVSDSIDPVPQELRPFVRFTHWRPGIENDVLPGWTVGIMPLPDNDWSRGKCAFKLLQYLAAGIPVVASPVGVNKLILDSGCFGFAANSGNDWADSLVYLMSNRDFCFLSGQKGREFVKEKYSLSTVADSWARILRKNFG